MKIRKATLEDIEEQAFSLLPSRFVGIKELDEIDLSKSIKLGKVLEYLEKIKKDFIVHFDAGVPGEPVKIFFQNKDVTTQLRTEEVAKKIEYDAVNLKKTNI